MKEYGSDAASAMAKYGDDAAKAIANYGDDAVDIINTYSVDGISALKNGIEPQTINQLTKKGIVPGDYNRLCIIDVERAEKILNCQFSNEDIIRQLNLQSCRDEIMSNISSFKADVRENFTDFVNSGSGKTVSLCMDVSNTNINKGACNGIYEYNPTIIDFHSQEEVTSLCVNLNDYVEYYKTLLTDDYIDEYFENIPNDRINIANVKNEMEKLRSAIRNTQKTAEKQNLLTEIYGAIKQYPSLEKDWLIENCAEIWAARNAILEGASFDDLIFRTEYLGNGNTHEMCKNCLATFQGHYVID